MSTSARNLEGSISIVRVLLFFLAFLSPMVCILYH